jgi:hypothetical protein
MILSELLEKYRATEYHYPDIVWQDVRVKYLKPILIEEMVNLSVARFEELLLSEWFMSPRLPEQTISGITHGNDFNEVKLRLLDLFLGKRSLKDRLQDVMDLKGIGPYIASQFLSAVDVTFIIYHENVLEGIQELLPHLEVWGMLPTVQNAEDYLKFNEVCRSIKERFNFNSLGEVHEFFWHGHKNEWEFSSST